MLQSIGSMPRMASSLSPIVVDDMPAAQRSLRIALVTETYPPEVNGVALTLQRIVEELHAHHHDIQLVRPRQTVEDMALRADRFHEVLMRGFPIPRYPEMKMGVPSKKALVALWSRRRLTWSTSPPKGRWAGRRCRLPPY